MSHTLTDEQIAHRESILADVARDFRKKYDRGQQEHGGNLWEHTDLIDRAIEETLDHIAYLYTLRTQLGHLTKYLPKLPPLEEAYAHRGDVPPFEE